jgi:transcription termination factor Rho
VDLAGSGTRREELLLPQEELSTVRGLRRALVSREGQGEGAGGYETLLQRLRATPDNAAFLHQVRPTLRQG